jgi:hypothetical protein
LLASSDCASEQQFDGLFKNNECRFGTIALVTLERAQIDTGGVRLDTGEHHLASTSLAFRPLDGLKLKKNKLGLRHGLLLVTGGSAIGLSATGAWRRADCR